MRKWKFGRDRAPGEGETCTITDIRVAKPAAVLFDKIWVGTRTRPEELDVFHEVPEELTFDIQEISWECFELFKQRIPDFLDEVSRSYPSFTDTIIHNSKLAIVEAYAGHGIQVIPTYPSSAAFARDFLEGQAIAYQAALNNLPLISNEDVTWDQILEFRRDKKALRKYRSLRFWLQYSLEAESVGQATDLIAERIDDYEWAIKKHGLKTVTGALSYVLNLKSVSSIATGAGLAALVGGSIWSAMTAGLMISAKLGVWIINKCIDREAIKREEYSDIALLYEARQFLQKSK